METLSTFQKILLLENTKKQKQMFENLHEEKTQKIVHLVTKIIIYCVRIMSRLRTEKIKKKIPLKNKTFYFFIKEISHFSWIFT